MKKLLLLFTFILFAFSSIIVLNSCDSGDTIIIEDNDDDIPNARLTARDKAALLLMLEEEKLARDTYISFAEFWDLQHFTNVMNSEQNHMDAIKNLLDLYGVHYTILPEGEFSDPELQDLYDQFIIEGELSKEAALTIGATIEDLDIYDLRKYMSITNNTFIISVFSKLECASENHLRAFVLGLTLLDATYTPQFISQEEYDAIINGETKPCW